MAFLPPLSAAVVETESVSIRPLLRQARGGSVAAIGSLLEAARGYMQLQASEHLPLSLQAKIGASDIVQETALDAHRDFGRFRGTTQEEFLGWLRAILKNNVVDAVRRFQQSHKRAVSREVSLHLIVDRDRHGIAIESAGSRTPDRSAIRREEAARLADVLERIPARYRTLLRMRYWDGLTFAQIGARIERSEDATRKLWFRAVSCLNRELEGLRQFPRPPFPSPPPHS